MVETEDVLDVVGGICGQRFWLGLFNCADESAKHPLLSDRVVLYRGMLTTESFR
jgi:hypothetical protein